MSAVEAAIEKVKMLDEQRALKLLDWLSSQNAREEMRVAPKGAAAMLGFAKQFHKESRSTAEWMVELREGESD